jgi:cell fate regulator YaaT (PSP1 superfamily)
MNCNHNNNKNCNLDMSRGCMFCGCNGGEGEPTACVREGCFKLHETDWLDHYPNQSPTDIFEVRFKNTRRSYYKNIHNLPLRHGDIVAVEASPGHDIGIVSLTGDMVARQMHRTGFSPQNGEFRAIYRKAKPYDIAKWQEAIAMEHSTMIRSRQIAKELRLDMKIGDVEYQGDKIKAIFYYIADGRVDFRELIKVFASEFGIKVEMKQIGARQEAGRIGGLGSCGRELCCTSWIASFTSVTTGAARTQDISLNPQKLAGQCCKLKCCLAYELDAYIDARKSLPRVNGPLQALDGDYWLISSDVLRGTMSFSTVKGAAVGNITLTADQVRDIVDANRRGQKPATIAGMAPVRAAEEEPSFVNMVGEESITRFDRGSEGRRKRGRQGRGNGGSGGGAGRPDGEKRQDNRGGANRQDGEKRSDNRGEKRPDNSGDKRQDNRPANRQDGEKRPQGGNGNGGNGNNGGEKRNQRHNRRPNRPQKDNNGDKK